MENGELKPEKQPDSAGGSGGPFGDGGLHAGKYNMALIRRAIRAGWPISDRMKKLICDQMVKIVGKGRIIRNQIAAARVLVAADNVNVRREAVHDATEARREEWLTKEEAGPTKVNVNVAVGIGVGVQELLKEREYIDYLRSRAVEEDCNAGAVCANGDGRAVENGQAPQDYRPSTNGHG